MIAPHGAIADPSSKRRAYFQSYYQGRKARLNARRTENRRQRKARIRTYLESMGLWPIIPEERLYEIPPNLRVLVLAKLTKRVNRFDESPAGSEGSQAETVLHENR